MTNIINVIKQTKAGSQRFVKESIKDSRLFDVQVPTPVANTFTQLGSSRLVKTPRLALTDNNVRGFIGWNEIPNFTLPTGKELVYMGAGRNQARSLGKDVFDWGFTALDESRMVNGTEYHAGILAPAGFVSPIPRNKRTRNIGSNFFANDTAKIWWGSDYSQWQDTYFGNAPTGKGDLATWINMQLQGWGDPYREQGTCPYRMVFVDVENIGNGDEIFKQETINLWVAMLKLIRDNIGSNTKLATLEPVAFNTFGFAAENTNHLDYYNQQLRPNTYLWNAQAAPTSYSTARNMPSNILGLSVRDLVDYNMAGTYWNDSDLRPQGTYPRTAWSGSSNYPTIVFNHQTGANWLTNLLGNQEINQNRESKKRFSWHWLFNNDGAIYAKKTYLQDGSAYVIENNYPDIPFTASQAEGLAIFHWFTGAEGAILWDNATDLIAGDSTPYVVGNVANPAYTGQGNMRNYAYKHYLHGHWRLFAHHGHLFDGNEQYLNENTEISFDGGIIWHKFNAVELRNHQIGLCARAIINLPKRRILVAAQHPYGVTGQTYSLKVRFKGNGISWEDNIELTGDKPYLGEAILPAIN